MAASSKQASAWLVASLLLATTAAGPAGAEPAPVPRAVVPATEAPEAMSDFYDDMSAGKEVIEIAGAEWLQLRLRRTRRPSRLRPRTSTASNRAPS